MKKKKPNSIRLVRNGYTYEFRRRCFMCSAPVFLIMDCMPGRIEIQIEPENPGRWRMAKAGANCVWVEWQCRGYNISGLYIPATWFLRKCGIKPHQKFYYRILDLDKKPK